jgi:hypothetical protein
MLMLSEDFAHLMNEYGAFAPVERVSAADVEPYRGKLPESLLTLWLECGRGAWLDGRFQFCDPTRYHPILELVFGTDADFSSRDCLPYGFTAFGELLVWSQRHQVVKVDLRFGWVTAPKMNAQTRAPDDLIIGITTLPALNSSNGDMVGADEKPLFNRAVAKLGQLELGEAYGFVPALALGGEAKLGNLKRLKAFEHFSILAQSTRFVLRDYTNLRTKTVRDIG